jgi:CheY-like chemotaxis protein
LEPSKFAWQPPWPTSRLPPLVALTGWGQTEDRQRTKAAGFDHHFVKPVEAEALRSLFAERSNAR